MIKKIKKDSEYLLDYDQNEINDIQEEKDYLESLSKIQIFSRRLNSAATNPKANEYFSQKPNAREGYDRTWVSAIDEPCLNNLNGVFRNYGIQFLDNFGDWEDRVDDDRKRSIEDIASFKARQVYEITGLPCIASRTSFEIEPVLPTNDDGNFDERLSVANKLGKNNQKVLSGYRFNDVGDHVDYLVSF